VPRMRPYSNGRTRQVPETYKKTYCQRL